MHTLLQVYSDSDRHSMAQLRLLTFSDCLILSLAGDTMRDVTSDEDFQCILSLQYLLHSLSE